MRKVVLIPYDAQWDRRYEEEARLLRSIFGEELVDIHHIGSTSIAGLAAKPVIDILPIVKDIERINRFDEMMRAAGYTPKGENGIPGRRYFQKGGDARTHHVHVYGKNSPEIKRHLAFRDFLRHQPEEAKQYGDLKMSLSARHPFDVGAYIAGKERFAAELESRALKWAEDRESDNRADVER
ncbi:GrpB family protein [Exiguobacterium flavidum]|uniref:GrpB family protein n=1 Tax=Exiguobacterium flavidum TaxID=2184695 RepID=UPI000DF793E9|nr:GrpB family protein [Exiguobacterium flavidum]